MKDKKETKPAEEIMKYNGKIKKQISELKKEIKKFNNQSSKNWSTVESLNHLYHELNEIIGFIKIKKIYSK